KYEQDRTKIAEKDKAQRKKKRREIKTSLSSRTPTKDCKYRTTTPANKDLIQKPQERQNLGSQAKTTKAAEPNKLTKARYI
ncbi:23620_t:CDS:1, partial [Gigaspora rosea]